VLPSGDIAGGHEDVGRHVALDKLLAEGKTDLLVTWLYKLTIDQQYYNLGAVIGIMTFVILTIITLTTYRNSSSYKNEEAFM